MSNNLLGAALSSISQTAIAIRSPTPLPLPPHLNSTSVGTTVDLKTLHLSQLVKGKVHTHTPTPSAPPPKNSARAPKDVVYIKTPGGKAPGKTLQVVYKDNGNVGDLMKEVADKEGIPFNQQRLTFNGKGLFSVQLLKDLGIKREATLQLTLRKKDGETAILLLSSDSRSPEFDYDFTEVTDVQTFTRGDRPYSRPCGWKRLALNVLDRYGDRIWLGVVGRKNTVDSVNGEWAVSYHGTGRHNLKSIAEEGFLLSKGVRFLFGNGIYCTPDIDVAELYASEFTEDGVTYKAVVQNRVNPKAIKVVTNEQTGGNGEYWVIEKEVDIRPYGICVKKK